MMVMLSSEPLQELQFQVLAFTNITLDQLRNALDLFASFIDEETYALFYYNGHAVGHNKDIYLATVESSLGEDRQYLLRLRVQVYFQYWPFKFAV